MIEYNFKRFESNGSGFRFIGINKKDKFITITVELYKKLNCESIIFSIDTDNKAILIKPADNYSMGYRVKKGSHQINITLGSEMPNGRYYFETEYDGGFVCIYAKNK